MCHFLRAIPSWDTQGQSQMDALLESQGIRRDGNLDYSCGIFDEDDVLLATGSCFGSTLRCLAVCGSHQGEGLLNEVVGHLMQLQAERGNTHLFVYTKPASARFLEDLGFREIAQVPGKLVFMENRRDGFSQYCRRLAARRTRQTETAGIVMNANPFTLGHLHLVEQAARENERVDLFILSEEAGPIPFAVRRKLVLAGVAHLDNVCCHDSGPYIISAATFPSYFLKDGDSAIETQAALDLVVFGKIAEVLGIRRRYVGREEASHVTALYNQAMKEALPKMGIACVEIPRLQVGGRTVSASTVRQAIHDGCLEQVRDLLPQSTYAYFAGPEGAEVTAAIRAEKNLIHY